MPEANLNQNQYSPSPLAPEDELGAATDMGSDRAKKKRGTLGNAVLNAARGAGRRLPNPVRNVRNAIQRRKIEANIRKLDKQARPINREISKLQTQVALARLGAKLVDALKAIGIYVGVMFELWWWTIIGAIIDILVVIPIIFLMYYMRLVKGAAGRAAEKLMTGTQKKIKEKQTEVNQINLQRRNQFVLLGNTEAANDNQEVNTQQTDETAIAA